MVESMGSRLGPNRWYRSCRRQIHWDFRIQIWGCRSMHVYNIMYYDYEYVVSNFQVVEFWELRQQIWGNSRLQLVNPETGLITCSFLQRTRSQLRKEWRCRSCLDPDNEHKDHNSTKAHDANKKGITSTMNEKNEKEKKEKKEKKQQRKQKEKEEEKYKRWSREAKNWQGSRDRSSTRKTQEDKEE